MFLPLLVIFSLFTVAVKTLPPDDTQPTVEEQLQREREHVEQDIENAHEFVSLSRIPIQKNIK